MTGAIVAIVAEVLPQIMAMVRAHQATHGRLPTDVELAALVAANEQMSAALTAKGEAWLRAHGQQPG